MDEIEGAPLRGGRSHLVDRRVVVPSKPASQVLDVEGFEFDKHIRVKTGGPEPSSNSTASTPTDLLPDDIMSKRTRILPIVSTTLTYLLWMANCSLADGTVCFAGSSLGYRAHLRRIGYPGSNKLDQPVSDRLADR